MNAPSESLATNPGAHPEASSAAPIPRVPLDEVMLAMDVVDTLRHEQAQVDAELNDEARQRALVERIRSIYESQGMDVSPEVIAQGVQALVQQRFVYEPPERTFQVRLAEVYVERWKWTWRLLIVAAVLAVAWAAWVLPGHFRREARAEAFRSGVSKLSEEAGSLQSQLRELRQRCDAGVAEGAPAIARDMLATAQAALEASTTEVRGLRERLAESVATLPEADRFDAVLGDHQSAVGGATRRLGAVDGQLDALQQLSGISARVRLVLARLPAATRIAPARRDQLAALQAEVTAAVSSGAVEEANRGTERLEALVQEINQERAERERLKADLARLAARAGSMSLGAPEQREVERLEVSVRSAIDAADRVVATRDLAELQTLVAELDRSYELRIVSGGNRKSAVRRRFRNRKDTRNHYILVEAIGADGRPMALRIRSEETSRTERVRVFGIRVPQAVYDRLGRDKAENGIIEDRRFGVKRRGQRAPEYRFPVSGGRITQW